MENKDTTLYYVWVKGEERSLSPRFNTREFCCQCSHSTCVEQRISKDLITRLTTLREEIGKPLTVTSGFRCGKHQQDLRDKGVNTVISKASQHELGNAADIKVKNTPVDEWTLLAKKYFFAIGLASTFLHLDTRPLRPDGSYTIWKY